MASAAPTNICAEPDVIIIGSGVAGLTAGLSAQLRGLSVLVLEHEEKIGGTSARSSGTVWVPNSHFLQTTSLTDSAAAASTYLSSLVPKAAGHNMWQTFLEAGPKMLFELEAEAGLSFKPYISAPDYRQDHPGAVASGRALEPAEFDGRKLGENFRQLAAPLPELTLFGGMMITRGEAARLLRADRSITGAWLGLKLLARYAFDRLTYARGTRLVLGNALVANLLDKFLSRGGEVLTDVQVSALVKEDDRVAGVEVEAEGGNRTISARLGVVMAGGGFAASQKWRTDHLPQPAPEFTPASRGVNGSSLELALAVGAALGPQAGDNAFWFPSSISNRPDGSQAVYPHIVLDRSKPGLIAVNGAGERFVNEAVSYHEFVRAMYRAQPPAVPAWLICDRKFIKKYGLGLVRPRALSLRKYIASNYLIESDSKRGLAEKIGVSADKLIATIDRYNPMARSGNDVDFAKGETIYDRSNGDSSVHPNPCMAPLEQAPFYAVAVYPTPLTTAKGIKTDTDARALRSNDQPVEGLYVCGNDMQSIFEGEYPGAGAQLGQAMTFGWIAANHMADHATNSGETAPDVVTNLPNAIERQGK